MMHWLYIIVGEEETKSNGFFKLAEIG